MKLDDEREIEETRAFFMDHGLLPLIPERYADGKEEAERVRLRILSQRKPASHTATWRRRALLAAAAAVIVAIGGGAQAVLHSAPAAAAETPVMLTYSVAGPESVDSAPSPVEVLQAAAREVAAASPPRGTGDVQYVARYGWLFSEHVGPDKAVSIAVHPTLTQWWLASDGTVRLDESRAAPLDLDGRLTDNVPDAPDRATSDTSPAGTIDPDLAARLSTEPAVLRSELLKTQAGLPCDEDARWQTECLLHAIQMVYDQYVVPPKVASAMWGVLANESDLHTLGTTIDRLGRRASTVALPPEPGQPSAQVIVMLVSENTGAYLGSETVTLRDSVLKIDRPTVTAFSELTVARRVDALGGAS